MLKDLERGNPYSIIIDVALYEESLRDKEIFRHIFMNEYSGVMVSKAYKLSKSQVSKIYNKCLKKIKTDEVIKGFIKLCTN